MTAFHTYSRHPLVAHFAQHFLDAAARQETCAQSAQNLGFALDVRESEAAYLVCAALPGVAKDDINITVERDTLQIDAELKAASDEAIKSLWSERNYGKATRRLRLPEGIDHEAVRADHAHGVLTLTLPKKATAQARRVTIN